MRSMKNRAVTIRAHFMEEGRNRSLPTFINEASPCVFHLRSYLNTQRNQYNPNTLNTNLKYKM